MAIQIKKEAVRERTNITKTIGKLHDNLNIVVDLTPQLGGDLDLNGFNIDFPTTADISDCLDEDNMASDSATMLATQQSIKAYADTKIPTANLLDEDDMVSDDDTKPATQQSIKAYVDTKTVDIPICISMFDAVPARASVSNWNGGILKLSDADTLSNGDNITVTKGNGKILLMVIASNDAVGDITVTGSTVDRNTGVVTGGQTDTITLAGDSTDNSTTDSNGNTVNAFVGAYISSKWFTGSVVLSTTEVDLTDVDVYHVSFEQVNDQPNLVLNTFDANLFTTNVNAEFDAYLYTLHLDPGDMCHVDNESELHVGADGETAIADKYWRLRRGGIAEALDGTTDGFWVSVYYANSPVYVEDVTIKVWLTKTQTLN